LLEIEIAGNKPSSTRGWEMVYSLPVIGSRTQLYQTTAMTHFSYS